MDGHWLGDAAGFLDPLYSQGFDFVSYTCCGIFGILADALAGKDVSKDRRRYNEMYHKQFHTWFESVYKDKYYYLGDLELMTIAFYLDISTYFIGPVRQAYSNHPQRYSQLPYAGPAGQLFGRFMRCYNRRLAALGKRKIAAGTFGLANLDSRLFLPGFSPGPGSLKFMLVGIRKWFGAELRNLFLPSSSDSKPGVEQASPLSRR